MDNKDFVDYTNAKRLKECGFNEPCNAFYWTCDGEFKDTKNRCHVNSESCDAMVTAPTLWQAQKWLREKKEIIVEARADFDDCEYQDPSALDRQEFTGKWCGIYYDNNSSRWVEQVEEEESTSPRLFDSYESALSASIKAALELIKPETK